MKKNLLITALVFAAACAWAQSGQGRVLPAYDGYWTRGGKVGIFDLVRFYPEQLPFLRNEIYARYGRAFVNQSYQDYFNSKSWYQVRSSYTDAWLSADDKYNAEFIRSVEQPALDFAATVRRLVENVEYLGGGIVLTFFSKQELSLAHSEEDSYSLYMSRVSAETWSYLIMGDWVIAYRPYNEQTYEAAAYRLNHARRRITDSAAATIRASVLGVLIEMQKNR
jgi:hypothetical protein